MKCYLLPLLIALMMVSCTKENINEDKNDRTIPASEFEALKHDFDELKAKFELLTNSELAGGITPAELKELKDEDNALKEQIALFTSGFFEVDGLRFDRNGTLISVPVLEKEVITEERTGTLTITRSYDAEGRVIEIMSEYSNYNPMPNPPYYWRKTIYEYSGKHCKTTIQTSRPGMSSSDPYEEEITEADYW